MDANTDGTLGAQRLPGLEGDLRREGSALLFPSERLPLDHQGASRRNPSSVHLHGVPQLLSMAARPNRRRFHCEQEMSNWEKWSVVRVARVLDKNSAKIVSREIFSGHTRLNVSRWKRVANGKRGKKISCHDWLLFTTPRFRFRKEI